MCGKLLLAYLTPGYQWPCTFIFTLSQNILCWPIIAKANAFFFFWHETYTSSEIGYTSPRKQCHLHLHEYILIWNNNHTFLICTSLWPETYQAKSSFTTCMSVTVMYSWELLYVLCFSNPQAKVRMKYRISYHHSGQEVVEMGEVSDFPVLWPTRLLLLLFVRVS